MSVTLRREEGAETIVRCFLEASIYGNCYPFAIAMHRGLGWQIIGLFREQKIIHAGVKSPEGKIWDGRGEISEFQFTEPFLAASNIPAITDITESDLFSRDDVSEYMIEDYLEKAQVIWPDLPWMGQTIRQQVTAFAEELEALSRKYKLWVCAPLLGMTPVLFRGQGDEKGYGISVTGDGVTYTINREL